MAEQKHRSQAEKAVSASRAKNKSAQKNSASTNTTKSNKTNTSSKSTSAASKNTSQSVKNQKQSTAVRDVVSESSYPVRLVGALLCLVLFVLFMVILLNPEGALVHLVEKVMLGMIGRLSFLFAIPAFVYLFFVYALNGKSPVLMRVLCTLGFVFVCGCISHLTLDPQGLPDGISLLGELYKGGYLGTTGGLLCGAAAMLLRWLVGTVIAYIILFVAALLLILGAMQITVPSIIRAVRNRPRAEWEDDANIKRQEPAAVVVNHIATKRIQHVEQRRQRAQQAAIEKKRKQRQNMTKEERLAEMMRQIHADTETPVAAAGGPLHRYEETYEQTYEEEPEEKPVSLKRRARKEAVAQKLLREEAAVSEPEEAVAEEEELRQMPQFQHEVTAVPSAQVVKPRKVTAREADESAAQVAAEIALNAVEEVPEYSFPPIDLLKLPAGGTADGTAEMRENSRRLNETLASFKIEAHIINVTRGPSVTRYEVELEKGVRLSKLTTAADDIALSLGASGVRIAAVPGKISVVGIEVPNRAVTTVSLREVIDSPDFSKAKSKSSFAVGKDISGNSIVGNIAKLPHMLIAGTTGSGKSVCMNSIIISLLYKASPDDVKLIMVDPKMVELGIYNGIPHLLIPVVTDPKKAAGSLQWAVTEMMRRYKAMSDAGVRDLASYNSIVEQDGGTKLPQVVVIIDELADLMLVAAKEVEESICRIAQMGRASGIHLIIATQRPSADVITGLMKANIPSRIAFAVASAMESRIILDTQGAEKLVGRGDMLFAPIGSGKPKRVQGCFVTDEEVEAVATYVKENYSTTYDQKVMEEIEKKAAQTGSKNTATSEAEPSAEEVEGDEMLPAAVDVILETGQASVSMLQRRLKLGYARAARIVDEMEERGIVGPFQGSKPRAILVTKEQWEQMRGGTEAQMGFEDLDMDDAAFEEDFE